MAELPTGPVILWIDYGYDGWLPLSFPTARAALEAPERGWSPWVITRLVSYDIVEQESVDDPRT